MNKMQLLYIDLFCGAGGTSTGVNTARINGNQCARVIACVNHDANAIASHAANHPDALHFTEDIRTLELAPLVSHVKTERAINPLALTVLWASLECSNFSKAKGGQPRDADSRTLAEHLFRYIEAIDPDYIQIENVEEFMSWGDIDENGKPISKDKGRCYLRWVNQVKRYGYDFDYRIMNAANYGAYTSRKRFFGIFAKKKLPIIFPEPTHCKNPKTGLFDEHLKKWNPVKDCLDFSNEGNSIFREKPLSEKTLERIYAGLIKFVAGGKEAFMIKYNSVNQKTGKYCPPSLEEPCPVVAAQNRLALAHVSFLSKQFGGNPNDKNISIEQPAGTITTVDHHAFITAYYSNGQNVSLENPSPTLMTKDKFGVVRMRFMDMQFGNGTPMSLDVPTGTIMTNPKQKLISVESPWIMDTSFGNIGSSIEEPSKVITANRKWHYLMNPQFRSAGGNIEEPCFTLIAKMDKRPPYLISTETGEIAIAVYETDSPMTLKIKEFMALYGIIDIKMRMLTIPELKKIMGFPEDYILIGTQADQKKFIGNAVEVTIARVWCESLCSSLKKFDIKKYQSQKISSMKNCTILDACCGGKMFYFDKNDERVLFQDIRKIDTHLCDGREFRIAPDIQADFTDMPYPDNQFSMVVFDPPHLLRNVGKSKFADMYGSLNPKAKPTGWQHIKYGALTNADWREILTKGFAECFRVLKPGGFLIFKWNETDIKVSEILKLTQEKPILGHLSGKRSNTHWILFMKNHTMAKV